MAWPKILYDPGAGDVTLNFLRPNRFIPRYLKKAAREDTVSSGGVKQPVLERIDAFIAFDMPWIQDGADAAAWGAFLDHALTGCEFDYYPDASLPGYFTCSLENDKAALAWKAPNEWELKGFLARIGDIPPEIVQDAEQAGQSTYCSWPLPLPETGNARIVVGFDACESVGECEAGNATCVCGPTYASIQLRRCSPLGPNHPIVQWLGVTVPAEVTSGNFVKAWNFLIASYNGDEALAQVSFDKSSHGAGAGGCGISSFVVYDTLCAKESNLTFAQLALAGAKAELNCTLGPGHDIDAQLEIGILGLVLEYTP